LSLANNGELERYKSKNQLETQDVLTTALIKAYLDQDNRLNKIQILSLFAHKYSKEKLMKLIPGLTVSKIDVARRHATLIWSRQGKLLINLRYLDHPYAGQRFCTLLNFLAVLHITKQLGKAQRSFSFRPEWK
jgi:predicted glutamine amidotransferase